MHWNWDQNWKGKTWDRMSNTFGPKATPKNKMEKKGDKNQTKPHNRKKDKEKEVWR